MSAIDAYVKMFGKSMKPTAEAQLKEAIEVIEFYGRDRNWDNDKIYRDAGQRARDFLAKIKKVQCKL